jgi:TolA-binding protein
MKAKQRHQLKQNDFADTALRVAGVVKENRIQAVGGLVAIAVIVAIVSGVLFWRKHQADQAGALLGIAMATAQAQIAPASTIPGAAQVSGTFPTEQARNEAALKQFQDVVARYPSTSVALAAEYQAAGELLSLGRFKEAEDAFRHVADRGASSIYGPMARMGLAETELAGGQTDEAIKNFTDLAAQRDSVLPIDGVLMQLAHAYEKAGKAQDAKATYKRVTDEFPQSAYAADAKQQIAALD